MKKIIAMLIALVFIIGLISISGCTDAEKVMADLANDADHFNTERHILVTNLRTGEKLYEFTGVFSVQDYAKELALIIKDHDTYRKVLISDKDLAFYVIEDIQYMER